MEPRKQGGSASASEGPAREYNFRPRSRSATALPKVRRLGSVGIQGSESALDLALAPPNSSTPLGESTLPTGSSISSPTLTSPHHALIPTKAVVKSPFPTLVGPDNPTLIPNAVAAGVSSQNPTLIYGTTLVLLLLFLSASLYVSKRGAY